LLGGPSAIRRRELIQFVRNERGGGHVPGRRNNLSKVRAFADLPKNIQIRFGDTGILGYELLSTAQALIASEDVRTLAATMTKNGTIPESVDRLAATLNDMLEKH
jgi:hypothetical protein